MHLIGIWKFESISVSSNRDDWLSNGGEHNPSYGE